MPSTAKVNPPIEASLAIKKFCMPCDSISNARSTCIGSMKTGIVKVRLSKHAQDEDR